MRHTHVTLWCISIPVIDFAGDLSALMEGLLWNHVCFARSTSLQALHFPPFTINSHLEWRIVARNTWPWNEMVEVILLSNNCITRLKTSPYEHQTSVRVSGWSVHTHWVNGSLLVVCWLGWDWVRSQESQQVLCTVVTSTLQLWTNNVHVKSLWSKAMWDFNCFFAALCSSITCYLEDVYHSIRQVFLPAQW